MSNNRHDHAQSDTRRREGGRRSVVERRFVACFRKHGGVIALATSRNGDWEAELRGKLHDEILKPGWMSDEDFTSEIENLIFRLNRENTLVICCRNNRMSLKLDLQQMKNLARHEGRRRKAERELASSTRLPRPRRYSPQLA